MPAQGGALQNAILTSANFSIIATDEKGIIQLFNVGAERMLGYRADEVVNRVRPSDMHDPLEVRARAMALSVELDTPIAPGFEALAFKASRGIEDIYELTYICKDGSSFPAIISITALRDDYGDLIGYLLIGTDNSVRKRGELQLNDAMAAAEKANRAKTDFISSMSHELRTPLNAILGFAQLLESGAPVPTPMQKRSIDQILKAGWYLLELINEILDLTLIESGKLTLSGEPVSLTEVLAECRAMVEPQAQQRSIGMMFARLEQPRHVNRPHAAQAGADQPAVQRHQIQPAGRPCHGGVHALPARRDPHQRARHRRRSGAGETGPVVPAVQPAGAGGRWRRGHRHRTGGDQAPGAADGWRDRRGQRARRGQRVLG
jgi:signal transduction histidine kinase